MGYFAQHDGFFDEALVNIKSKFLSNGATIWQLKSGMNDIKQTPIQTTQTPWLSVINELAWISVGGIVLLIIFFLSSNPELAFWLAPFRFGLGLLFVIYFPGYCLTAVLFPRRNDLDNIERVGLSLGLSIAWVSILALILNGLPTELSFWPIVTGEFVGTGIFIVTAVYRRASLPSHDVYAPAPILPRSWWQSKNSVEKRVLGSCLVALFLISGSLTVSLTAVSPQDRFTEFYMLGKAGLAENFPRTAVLGELTSVNIGIHNEEQQAKTYHIEIIHNDVWTSETTLLQTIEGIQLAAGHTWQEAVAWQMREAGSDQQVSIYLFIEGQDEPYRELRLWLDVQER